MKLFLYLSIGLLTLGIGVVAGIIHEAHKVTARQDYLKRIHHDYKDSIGE